MVAADVRDYYDQQAKKRQRESGGDRKSEKAKKTGCGTCSTTDSGKARDQAGAAVGVSGKTVDKAAKVLKEGTPELAKAVRKGEVTVNEAARANEDGADPKTDPACCDA